MVILQLFVGVDGLFCSDIAELLAVGVTAVGESACDERSVFRVSDVFPLLSAIYGKTYNVIY